MLAQTVFIKTFGCQMNEYDSERLETIASSLGYLVVNSEPEAQLTIVNTCSIREKAENKLMGYLGELRKLKEGDPSRIIVVSGCVAQQEGEALQKSAPFVDLVIGTDQVDYFDDHLKSFLVQRQRKVFTKFLARGAAYDPKTLPSGRKSFVAIMKGCDKVCTYCIVPFTRGREKSRPMNEILSEVKYLVDQGHKEVTLIGQNVNSYGKDLGELQFAELLHRVHEISGLEGIRFTTSHPIDLSDELVDCFRTLPKLCSSFHLPVQSGSNRILDEMRREYTIEWYLNRLEALREARRNMAISTDIIVGFPTETEDDFQATMTLLETARFDSAYSFVYSPRPMTRALKLKDPLTHKQKSQRLQVLQKRLLEIALEINQKSVGLTLRAYVEGPSRSKANLWSARTSQNKVIHFDPSLFTPPPKKRDIIYLDVTEAHATSLRGEPHGIHQPRETQSPQIVSNY